MPEVSTVEDFDRRYRADPDPWRFATSPYEQRRYDVTVACLPQPRFRRAFEPGCSVGELSRRLAQRCDASSPGMLRRPWSRLHGRASLRRHTSSVAAGAVPGDWPGGTFDLIVLSEIGYYFELDELHRLAARATASLDPGGTLIAAHWLGNSADHVLHGDEVHAALAEGPDCKHRGVFRDVGFRVDWWTRQ